MLGPGAEASIAIICHVLAVAAIAAGPCALWPSVSGSPDTESVLRWDQSARALACPLRVRGTNHPVTICGPARALQSCRFLKRIDLSLCRQSYGPHAS